MNFSDIGKFSSIFIIRDWKNFPEFIISDSLIYFDSRAYTSEVCELIVRQRYYDHHVKKTTFLIRNKSNGHGEIRFRPNKEVPKFRDIVDLGHFFEGLAGDFDNKKIELVYSHKYNTARKQPDMAMLVVDVKEIDSYTDEELLAELHKRSMARVGDFRVQSTIVDEEIAEIINMQDYRKNGVTVTKEHIQDVLEHIDEMIKFIAAA